MIRIGLVQAASLPDPEQNLHTLRRFAALGQAAHCEAICFPECFLTGYAPRETAARALSETSPLLQQVSQAAAESSLDLLVGYMERREEEFYITHTIFRRDGTRVSYRKTHLGTREQEHFLPGDRLEVFLLSCGIPVGFQLCVETHYPEIAQTLALKGAKIIFAPHAVPRAAGDRENLWTKYIPARGYDNRVYIACCNQWDEDRFGGGCLVADPQGDCTAAFFEDEEHLLTWEMDPDMVDRYRDGNGKYALRFFPARRRKELYE